MTGAVGQEANETLTNADIVTLTDAGLSLSAILTVIEAKDTDFDLSVEQLAVLSRASVDSVVIQAMVRTTDERPGPEQAGRLDQYIRLIENRIQQNWIRPASAPGGLDCVVNITQIPSGDVVDVRVGRCNGDEATIRSLEAAVLRSSPLPRPPTPSMFERNLQIIFRPDA